MREARFREPGSTIDILLDRHFTEWLPVWVMVIEHPDGIFLIDTGECAEAGRPGYFKPAGWLANGFITTQFKFSIRREEEIDRQLAALGIPIRDIRSVILTHLHFDHTDGLKHFPSTPILVNKLEWERPFGVLPELFPCWFKPSLFSLEHSLGTFQKAHYLNEDLVVVHTPGHTFGHSSVMLLCDDCHVFFAGDICYTQRQLIENKFSARCASRDLARRTYNAVKQYAREYPLVFLPSHDSESGHRLQQRLTL
jgi:glyoxylase-like metal-dependent hydrolase (beta-lactamase superfamily II)